MDSLADLMKLLAELVTRGGDYISARRQCGPFGFCGCVLFFADLPEIPRPHAGRIPEEKLSGSFPGKMREKRFLTLAIFISCGMVKQAMIKFIF